MGAHALRYEPTEPTLALVDNIECGEQIVAKAQQVQAEILEHPTARTRRTRAARVVKPDLNGPVETRKVKPHPLVEARARELKREHKYPHLKIISETEVVLLNTFAPVRRGRR